MTTRANNRHYRNKERTSGNICIILLVQLIAVVALPTISYANISLSSIWTDHMVLQQESPVKIWGLADPGERVVVDAGFLTTALETVADSTGKWALWMQTAKAGGPYTITVKGNNTIEIKDVMLGEVWVCSGQSNMVFSLKGSDGAAAAIAKADRPAIRYFSVHRQYPHEEIEEADSARWQLCQPTTAPGFSAVAYYFATTIQERLHVPVGIIYSAWGGTPAEAWTPAKAFESDSILQLYQQRWQYILDHAAIDSARYIQALAEWKRSDEAKKASDPAIKKPTEPQSYYYYQRPWREPSVLFNGMIRPLVSYRVRGVLWYQGESNVGYASEYEHLFTTMIKSWRAYWKEYAAEDTLPFYFVQLPPYGYGNLLAAHQLREAQQRVTNQLPNTGMAVTMDIGNMQNIHPTHKQPVGERLALLALANLYGFNDIISHGPEVFSAQRQGKQVKIWFSQSLLTSNKEVPQGFELGMQQGDSVVYKMANAVIHGRTILLPDDTGTAVSVRYAALYPDKANIINREGLPAGPFTLTIQ
jgi:sialate O-acetylesterase